MPEPLPASLPRRTEGAQATAWLAVVAATACGVAVSMNIGKLAVALPLLRAELRLSLVDAGWLVATFNLIAMLSGIAMGIVSDRCGALRFCMAGMALSLAGSLLAVALGDSHAALMASRIIEGVGFIAVAASAPALVSVATRPQDRRLSLAVWSCFMPAGACLCMAAAPAALAHGGWRGLWWLVIAIGAATATLLWLQRRAFDAAQSGARHSMVDVTAALRNPLSWWLALAMAGYVIQFFTLVNWMPTYLRDVRGLDAASVAWLTAVVVGANVPGNLLSGVLLHRGFSRGTVILTASALMLAFNLGIYTDILDDRLRLALCIALNLVGGTLPAAVNSSSTALAQRPQQVGTLQGLYMQSANLAQFFGALAVAAAVSSAGGEWSAALWVIAPVAVLSGLAGLRYRRDGR